MAEKQISEAHEHTTQELQRFLLKVKEIMGE